MTTWYAVFWPSGHFRIASHYPEVEPGALITGPYRTPLEAREAVRMLLGGES